MLKQLCGIALTGLMLSACSSMPTATNAIQRENNQFEVTGLGKSRVLATNNAISAANKTCRNSNPVVVNEEFKYNGIGDEKTGRIIEQAASVVGVLTGSKTGTGISREDDYATTLTFYCKK